MKKKFISFLVFLGAALSIAVYFIYENESFFKSLLPVSGGEYYDFGQMVLIAVFSFPFSLIGKLLAALSEAGNIGNGFAFAVLALLSCAPLVPVFRSIKNREKRLRNTVLVLMCPLTAIVLIAFCNNTFLSNVSAIISTELNENVKAVFGAAMWSGIVAVILTEIVCKIKNAEGMSILKLAKAAAFILSAFLTVAVSVFETGEFFSKINMGIGLAEGYMSTLCLIKDSLHYILDIAVISSAVSLIDSICDRKSSEEIGRYAQKLSNRSIKALLTIILVSFLYNFIQIILSPVVFSNVFVKIDIPVFSICFVLMLLLISKLVTENKRLEEDNDLFI